MAEQAQAFIARVRGRVQGVMFRDFARRKASALGLAGYARNLPGGASVEVFAEGSRESLEGLLAHLRAGPPLSRVDGVEVTWTDARGERLPFHIVP